MTKNLFFALAIFIILPFMVRAEWIPLNKNKQSYSPPVVTLISDNDYSTVLKIDISGFDLQSFTSGGKTYQKIDLLSESFVTDPGLPELPYIAKVLAIPDQAGISYEIMETGEIQTFKNITLPPAKVSWFEGSEEPSYVEDAKAYQASGIFPGEAVQIDPPAVFRDFRIARVSVYPLRFIAAKNELQVITSITVKIKYGSGEIVNPKTATKKPIAPSFGELYKNFIFNYESVLNKSYGGKETGHELMLCIMPDEYVTSFQTYANWKRQSGIDIHITKFSDIGATSTNYSLIKTHIADAYHNWEVPPTYVLAIGDNGVFPHTTANGYVSENYFVEIDGNDYFPELMIGRFTNESDYVMQVMINKFIKYEKTPYMANTDWYKKGICCSNNAYPSQAETKRFAAEVMLQDGGFTSVDTMMMPASGCPYNLTDVKNAINNGRSFLNYRGEGWFTGWWASCYQFSTSDVTTLVNGEKFTYVTSIGCGVANFTSTTSGNCFGEEWMEIGSIAAPKGAAAFVGPTGNTHTTYNNKIDKGIYIGMFQEGLETPGQALLRGKLYMYNVFGGGDSYVSYHYKIYCVLGDPSIHIWKDIPKAITVNYPAVIPFGSNLVEFTVTQTSTGSPIANAVVCVSGSDIFATATTNASGKAYVDVFYENIETLTVTVRGGNAYPYIGTLQVIQPTGPYVIRETYSLNDIAGGNGNGHVDYSESILLSLTVKNVGTQSASNVVVTLSTDDPYITITDNTHNYGNIASGEAINAVNAYAFNAANNLPDQHEIIFNVSATDGNSTWNSNFTVLGNAPVLGMGNLVITDPTGNDNGRLDPGETVTISVPVNNTGHSTSPYVSVGLTTASPYVTINNGNAALGQIVAGNSANATFSITCSPSAPIGESVGLQMNVNAGGYSFSQTRYTPIGLILEDWETGDFTRFPWSSSGNANWAVVSSGQYEGAYTAISGSIEHNQSTSLSVQLQVTSDGTISFYRKVSSEANYDYLRFYIDGAQQGQWSGTADWAQVSYPVTAGTHTFRWTYSKDGSVVSGLDCAWVDYIIFPPSIIVAPEINVTPNFFNKMLLSGSNSSNLLTITNSGNSNLNFSAELIIQGGGSTTTTVYPSNGNYWTGSCSASAKTQTSLVKGYNTEDGWFMFDISTIPPGTNITSVEFYGYVNGTNYPYWSMTPVNNNPLTTEAATLYTDINAEANSGYYLYRNETSSFATGWHNYILGGNVTNDLQSAVNSSQGWFAMGMVSRDNSTTWYINWDGWNEANKPYLVVTHATPQTWININGGTLVTGSVAPGNSQNINVSFNAGSYPNGTYQASINITSNDADEGLIVIPCSLTISNGWNLIAKVMLEGPFSGTAMNTTINPILPLSHPYNTSPWNYTGTESVVSMPANAVDWVLVELRDAVSPATATTATRIARQAGLLLNTGNIVNTNGLPMFFANSISNNLYVVIHHRNHLSLLSANALIFSGDNFAYDFTVGLGQAYGSNAQKQLTTGAWGMISGDINANGLIGSDDLVPAWKSNAGKTGYYPADLNLDRHVNNKDKDSFWFPNNGAGSNVPD